MTTHPNQPTHGTESTEDASYAPPDVGSVVATPVPSLDDPRAITILSTEHWSLLTSRSLAYNEAFTRGGMFLAFLSTSFVALALLSQGMQFGESFLTVAAVVLAFDLVIGLTTYGRILGANMDDGRAVHGIARIRHGYTQIAPIVAPYFTTATYDDSDSVNAAYGSPETTTAAGIFYALTTSAGMIGLIVAMVGGVFIAVLSLIVGVEGGAVIWIGVAAFVLVFVMLFAFAAWLLTRPQDELPVLFPAPKVATGAVPPSHNQS